MKTNVKLILGSLVFIAIVVTIILIATGVIDVSSLFGSSSTTTTPKSTTTTPKSTTTTTSSGGSPPPTKNCNLENGICTEGKQWTHTSRGNCIGGEQMCGINMGKPHPAKADAKTCKAMLDQYGVSFFTCNPGYTKSVKPVQGKMCQFTCEKCEKKQI
jgi:hypothetical protein